MARMCDWRLSDDGPSIDDILRLLDTVSTAVDATTLSASSLLKTRAKATDAELDLSAGLSLLLVRPHLLLTSLHHLVNLVGLRLSAIASGPGPIQDPDASGSSALTSAFGSEHHRVRDIVDVDTVTAASLSDEIAGELVLCHEVMDKVRGMESKLEYQVKKLVGLAEADSAKTQSKTANDDDVEEDPLSFRPNPRAMVDEKKESGGRDGYVGASASASASASTSVDGVYRPPRVAAMPYREPNAPSRRTERRAPALLSEFASSIDTAPGVQTTSGLSTRPVLTGSSAQHSNSVSAKRAAELKRIEQFEEDNMTRLVTTKREMKRRRDDEEALALGFGVGGSGRGRGRRQNGLEAELEGVLGERGSKGVWDGVGKGGLGKREGLVERGKRATTSLGGGAGSGVKATGPKKARFEKDVKKKRRAIGLV